MENPFDIAVVGAGPAGGNAAMAAAQNGARVVLIAEQLQPGGQVWRSKSSSILSAPMTPEGKTGDALRSALTDSTVSHLTDTRVWDIRRQDEKWVLQILQNGAAERVTAHALILATGAREFVQPIPGWTKPGVIGLASATSLFKQSLTLAKTTELHIKIP